MKRSPTISAILIILSAIFFKVHATDHELSDDTNPLTVTVYQNGGANVQPNARVKIYNSSGTELRSMLTNSVGVAIFLSFNQSIGYYTIKTWYPDLPNDGQFAQKTFLWDGMPQDQTITLGPNY